MPGWAHVQSISDTSSVETDACAISPASETRLSDTIDVLASGCAGERIAFDDLTSVLGPKCIACLLVLLAAPNLLPLPPGADILLSVPLAILSVQLMLGMRRPWLPEWILRREVSTELFAKVAERLSPLTRRAETRLNRRFDPLSGLVGRRVIGLVCLSLSIMIALPVPLGNAVPAAAIALFGLGLMARDGIAVLGGIAVTIASGAILAGMGYGAFEAGTWLIEQFGG